MSEVIKIVNSDGNEMEVNVIMSFEVEETGKQYIIYKKTDEEENMDTIYASLLQENNGEYTLTDMTEEEWTFVKSVMGSVVNSKED